jgi:hypothetical protein
MHLHIEPVILRKETGHIKEGNKERRCIKDPFPGKKSPKTNNLGGRHWPEDKCSVSC